MQTENKVVGREATRKQRVGESLCFCIVFKQLFFAQSKRGVLFSFTLCSLCEKNNRFRNSTIVKQNPAQRILLIPTKSNQSAVIFAHA